MGIKVLGAGVIGLSSAVVLAKAGFPVRVVAAGRDSDSDVASSAAAAFWCPFHVGDYRRSWATSTYNHFIALLSDSSAGITEVAGQEYFQTHDDLTQWIKSAWWRHIDRIQFRRLDDATIPKDFVAGVGYTVPVIHMPTYLSFLEHKLVSEYGGNIQIRRVRKIEDELSDCDLLVNCTGIGSRDIEDMKDTALIPCCGQVVSVGTIPEPPRAVVAYKCAKIPNSHERAVFMKTNSASSPLRTHMRFCFLPLGANGYWTISTSSAAAFAPIGVFYCKAGGMPKHPDVAPSSLV